jgi:hypothetical protein
MNYPLRRSCKEVANMVLMQQDRALNFQQLLALRLHMAVCKACPVFQNQFSVMKNAMRQWRNYAHEDAESGPSDAAN